MITDCPFTCIGFVFDEQRPNPIFEFDLLAWRRFSFHIEPVQHLLLNQPPDPVRWSTMRRHCWQFGRIRGRRARNYHRRGETGFIDARQHRKGAPQPHGIGQPFRDLALAHRADLTFACAEWIAHRIARIDVFEVELSGGQGHGCSRVTSIISRHQKQLPEWSCDEQIKFPMEYPATQDFDRGAVEFSLQRYGILDIEPDRAS